MITGGVTLGRRIPTYIFSIIDNAIMVAASDCPKKFKLRHDAIVELLFSCRLARCLGCDQVELAVDGGNGKDDCGGGGGGRRKSSESEVETGGSKESKINSSRDDRGEGIGQERVFLFLVNYHLYPRKLKTLTYLPI
ncbi:putative mediator of RNA polymerase II transcription subunit 26b [Arachis hypogaea]|nr:putative mediator of RNA polymerase II transcription subunit 26b [Arachis hypogaea]